MITALIILLMVLIYLICVVVVLGLEFSIFLAIIFWPLLLPIGIGWRVAIIVFMVLILSIFWGSKE